MGCKEDNLVSEFALYFREETENAMDRVYTSHIRVVEGQDLLEWEIRMNGVEIDESDYGREVIAKW